jgi:hypothetical protein
MELVNEKFLNQFGVLLLNECGEDSIDSSDRVQDSRLISKLTKKLKDLNKYIPKYF